MAIVRVTQLDGKLPNLALMRLSAWHKAQGDDVHFETTPHRGLWEPDYDVVYGSAIFSTTAPEAAHLLNAFPGAVVGGTGTPSKVTVEQIVPAQFTGLDYTLWPTSRASLGFTQRGCRLKCAFCVVPEKEGKPQSVATIADIWRGPGYPKHIHLLDNDFFGNPEWRDRIEEIRSGGFKVCFNQGINVRILTNEIARALATIEYRDDGFQRRRLYTAWDNLGDERIFFRGVDRLEEAGVPPTHLMAYMLVGYDPAETWGAVLYRMGRMVERGIRPFPMVYGENRPDLDALQRWVIRREYLWKPLIWRGRKLAEPFEQKAKASEVVMHTRRTLGIPLDGH
jgi:hypothetical protein